MEELLRRLNALNLDNLQSFLDNCEGDNPPPFPANFIAILKLVHKHISALRNVEIDAIKFADDLNRQLPNNINLYDADILKKIDLFSNILQYYDLENGKYIPANQSKNHGNLFNVDGKDLTELYQNLQTRLAAADILQSIEKFSNTDPTHSLQEIKSLLEKLNQLVDRKKIEDFLYQYLSKDMVFDDPNLSEKIKVLNDIVNSEQYLKFDPDQQRSVSNLGHLNNVVNKMYGDVLDGINNTCNHYKADLAKEIQDHLVKGKVIKAKDPPMTKEKSIVTAAANTLLNEEDDDFNNQVRGLARKNSDFKLALEKYKIIATMQENLADPNKSTQSRVEKFVDQFKTQQAILTKDPDSKAVRFLKSLVKVIGKSLGFKIEENREVKLSAAMQKHGQFMFKKPVPPPLKRKPPRPSF